VSRSSPAPQVSVDLSGLFIQVTMLAFKERAFAPITGAFLASLPKSDRRSVVASFEQAANPDLSDPQRESLLLAVLNRFPQDPFVAFRLACFHAGCGSTNGAENMMKKARYLAAGQKIAFSVLTNS
jgi:hypothetical protein